MTSVERVWLQSAPAPTFVVVHGAAEPRRARAVLLCSPFGWEEMCSYRGRRGWAQALAGAGYPCARIDLPGTGDSGAGPALPDLVAAWRGAVADTAGWLREWTGCDRVVALGIGLGGLMACAAAQSGAPIDDFVLWGVPAGGRALLRELRAYASVVAGFYADERSPDTPGDGSALELTGFGLSAETAAALERLRLRPEALAPMPGGRRALLLGRDGLPVDKRLVEGLRASGAEVTVFDTNEWGVLVGDPQQNGPPTATIERTLAWLDGGVSDAGGVVPNRTRSSLRYDTPRVEARPRVLLGDVAETVLEFGGELEGCVGILTARAAAPVVRAPLMAVWLNPGALHHIGPSRMWVELARRWAARGVASVRVDLPGIGDSDGPAPRPLPDAANYVSERIAQSRAVLDQLAARGLAERFVIGGLCSGAYWALHATLEEPRVAAAVLVNLYTFSWSEAFVVERGREQTLNAFLHRVSGGRMRAQASIRPDGGVFYHPPGEPSGGRLRKLSPVRLHSALRRPIQRAQAPEIERVLDSLRERRTETLLLLSRGEGLLDQLRRQGVLAERARWPNLTVEEIPTRDHMFRALWLQRHVHAALDRALERALVRRGVDDGALDELRAA